MCRIDQSTPLLTSPSSVVEGEVTTVVRLVRILITAMIVAAIVAGIVRGITSGEDPVVNGLYLTQAALAAILILLGSFVEGFGFGLSLGTQWPYTRNIVVLMIEGDPEAAHRIVATLVGLIGVLLVILASDSATTNGLILIVITAVLGVGTLHVLAGRLPSVVHGVHGLLAYGVFICYLTTIYVPGVNFWSYLGDMTALRAVLVAVLLGGMTTGQRGFGKAIGAFSWPRRLPQLVTVLHLIAALFLVATLGWLMPQFPVAFYLAVAQVSVGFLLFHAVNLQPKSPGILVAFHQAMVLAITVAIVAA
ncbi:MAG: cytochrome C oxidase assembly protein [Actinobacteria bacterium]|nr:cytochrome C oxidase assembly protein [Actinomycetota bacterium]